MATISISVVAGGNTKTVTKTVSSGDLVRFLTAMKTKYGPITTNGTERARTDDEAVDAWAADIFNEGKRYTREYERQQQQPADIAFT